MALNKRRISTKKMTRPILSWILRVVCRHCKRSPGLSHSARLAAWLVRAGAEVNCVIDGDGDTPLHVLRDRDTCRLLVERGADVHAPNTRGHTPLHVAARRGAADTAQLLLDHGAAAAARDGGGATPLQTAGTGTRARCCWRRGRSWRPRTARAGLRCTARRGAASWRWPGSCWRPGRG